VEEPVLSPRKTPSPHFIIAFILVALAALTGLHEARAQQTRRPPTKPAPGVTGTRSLPRPRVFVGRVTRVADGDTLTVRESGKSVTLRLRGVDAPALAQPYGQQARKFLSDSLLNRDVRVEARGDRDRTSNLLLADVYGRTDVVLGGGGAPGGSNSTAQTSILVPPRVMDPTGTRPDLPKGLPGPTRDLPRANAPEENVGEALVRAGLAWADVRFAASDKTFADLQAEARREKRGLWAAAARPVPPWQFRSRRGAAGSSTRP
jgi:endonuclease YncB( thermonuclease family)